jgi:hypothetical protein
MTKSDYTEREQWFIDRIGKTIFRNKDTCPCAVCERVYQEGLTIDDELHARYVADVEGMSNAEGTPLRYFDTKEEVLEFEKCLIKN